MKGVLLAGGKGTRLMPFTKVTNKHLAIVYDKPMIDYPLKTLTDAGLDKIMLVSGREHAGHFMEYLGSGKDLDIDLTYKIQDDASGIAHALSLAEDFADEDNIAVILGDNIFEDNFKDDMQLFKSGAQLFLKEVEDAYRFAVVELEDNKIARIVEKPENPVSKYISTGLYLYDHRVFDVIRSLKPSNRGEYEITDVNNAYLNLGNLDFRILKGFWSDAGTIPSLYKATSFLADKGKR